MSGCPRCAQRALVIRRLAAILRGWFALFAQVGAERAQAKAVARAYRAGRIVDGKRER